MQRSSGISPVSSVTPKIARSKWCAENRARGYNNRDGFFREYRRLSAKKRSKKGLKKRVDFRRNRSKPARQKNWDVPDQNNELAEDVISGESVRAKGALSRKRTVVESTEANNSEAEWQKGKVVAVRGQFVEVDDGDRVWPCTIRRILRTLRIEERSPVAIGDDVAFSIVSDTDGRLVEGVIEKVFDRRTMLKRSDGRKTHTIAANVDQAIIITSIREPTIKPHLIDRYLVAASAGRLPTIICINKIDLDEDNTAEQYLDRFRSLNYTTLATSTITGEGIDELRALMTDRISLLAGQSGVGKSSLLNAIDSSLDLKTGHVSAMTEKGRHTTTTAVWLKLPFGGAAVDTPGIRALDVAMVPLNEIESHFVEFVDLLANCKYPNCVHIHEDGCAILDAVEAGVIDPARYDSYYQLFVERSELK